MTSWIEVLKLILIIVPVGGILVLLIRSIFSNFDVRISRKQDKGECALHVKYFTKELDTLNGAIIKQYDSLALKFDEQTKIQTQIVIELAKLTQKVADLLKNGR